MPKRLLPATGAVVTDRRTGALPMAKKPPLGRRRRGDGPPRRRVCSAGQAQAEAQAETPPMTLPPTLMTQHISHALSRKRSAAAPLAFLREPGIRRRISTKERPTRTPEMLQIDKAIFDSKVTIEHIRCSGGDQPFWAFQMALNAAIRLHEDPLGRPTCDALEIFNTALVLSAKEDGGDRVHRGFNCKDGFIVFTWPRMLNWLCEEQLQEVVKDGVTNVWISPVPGTQDLKRQQRDNVPRHLPCLQWVFVIERWIGTESSLVSFLPTLCMLPAIVQPCPAITSLAAHVDALD